MSTGIDGEAGVRRYGSGCRVDDFVGRTPGGRTVGDNFAQARFL